MSTLFNAICATNPGLSVPGSDGNEGVLCIPQSSSTTKPSPSDCLVSYIGHSLEESYTFAEKQLVYSTAPVDWVMHNCQGIEHFLDFKTIFC